VPFGALGDAAVIRAVPNTTPPFEHYIADDWDVIDNEWPVTITSSTGQVPVLEILRSPALPNEGARLNVRSLRFEGVEFDVLNQERYPGPAAAGSRTEYFTIDPALDIFGESSLYLSSCELSANPTEGAASNGSADSDADLYPVFERLAYADGDSSRIFIEDSTANDIYANEPFLGCGWLRNVHQSFCPNAGFLDCEAVIDCQINDNRTPTDNSFVGPQFPPRQAFVWEATGFTTNDNALCDGLEQLDGGWCGAAYRISGVGNGSNFAIVNSLFMPDTNYALDQYGGPAYGWAQVGEPGAAGALLVTNHVLLQHVTVHRAPMSFNAFGADMIENLPCGSLAACIGSGGTGNLAGFLFADTSPAPMCGPAWAEGLAIDWDSMHEVDDAGNPIALCLSTADSELDTFVSTGSAADRFKINLATTADVNDVDPFDLYHKYALRARRRGQLQATFSVPGARRRTGE
jgi:hypothetical protein